MKKDILVGAIRWDAVDSTTFFGSCALERLLPDEFKERLPFYTKTDDNGNARFDYTQETFDTEMEYAIKAGLDYFAYCYYSRYDEAAAEFLDYDPARKKIAPYIHGLTIARQMHKKSKYKDNVKFCDIMCAFPLTQRDIDELAEDMASDYYVKIGDRPLLYIFQSQNLVNIENMRKLLITLKQKGVKRPFIVPVGVRSEYSLITADASGGYSIDTRETTSFRQLCDDAITYAQSRADADDVVIPLMSLGWDPRPRIVNKNLWCCYDDVDYPGRPNLKDVTYQAEGIKKVMESVPESFVGHVLVSAWNEFEEGSYACPTIDNHGNIDDSYLKMLKEMITIIKE